MINHTIKFAALVKYQIFTLPPIAISIVGISAISESRDGTLDGEIELILNDDRNHWVTPIQSRSAMSQDAKHVGIEKCDIKLIKNASHAIVIINTLEITTLHLILETCQDEQESAPTSQPSNSTIQSML